MYYNNMEYLECSEESKRASDRQFAAIEKELLSCPFCGSQPQLSPRVEHKSEDWRIRITPVVSCTNKNCGIFMNGENIAWKDYDFTVCACKNLVHKWNTQKSKKEVK